MRREGSEPTHKLNIIITYHQYNHNKKKRLPGTTAQAVGEVAVPPHERKPPVLTEPHRQWARLQYLHISYHEKEKEKVGLEPSRRTVILGVTAESPTL